MKMKDVISLKVCSYLKKEKSLKISSEFFAGSFPREFYVRSHHTNKVVKFIYDEEKAKRQEFWDGEYAEYIPEVPMKNIERAVVIHEY
jgi:hypothetical protein